MYLVQRAFAVSDGRLQLAQTCIAQMTVDDMGRASETHVYEFRAAPFRVWVRVEMAPRAADGDDDAAERALTKLRQDLWRQYRLDHQRLLQQWLGQPAPGMTLVAGHAYAHRIANAAAGGGEVPGEFMFRGDGGHPLADAAAAHGALCFMFYDMDAAVFVAQRLVQYAKRVADDWYMDEDELGVIDRITLLDPWGTFRPWGHVNEFGDTLYGLLQLPVCRRSATTLPMATEVPMDASSSSSSSLPAMFFFPTLAARSLDQPGPVAAFARIVVDDNHKWLSSKKEAERLIQEAYLERGGYAYFSPVYVSVTAAATVRHVLPPSRAGMPSTALVGTTSSSKTRKTPPTPRAAKDKRRRDERPIDEALFGHAAKRARTE